MGFSPSTINPCESTQHTGASLRKLPVKRHPVKDAITQVSIAALKKSLARKRAVFQTSSPRAFSRNRYSILLLSIVFIIEGVVILVVIHDLHNSYLQVVEIYERSVRGLWRIGEVQYEAQETRRSTMYALTTINGNLQVDYADQSREADRRVTEGIADFVARAQTSQERSIGEKLAKDWTSYLRVRDEVLGLILEGSEKDAIELDISKGAPQFERVRQDLQDVKQVYDERASERLAAVAAFSQRSSLKLTSALCFGLFLGSIAVWLVQRSTMRASLQLASLQMDIVASVSHELRTPITAILSAGENFRDGILGEDDMQEHGSIITGQARQLKSLVDQVLIYAAAVKDRPWHDVRLVNTFDLINDALSKVSVLLREGEFTVGREIKPDLPPVAGDLSLLSQCLQNLIANAVKYSGDSRWVGISADLVGMGLSSAEVQISVHDHGIGIASADLAHVFEPFYRGRRSVQAQIRGTGLGLSIAKRCAEAFGGYLTVASEEGIGSVFTLHLPASGTGFKRTIQTTG
jgi:signal transduction histidine kinase